MSAKIAAVVTHQNATTDVSLEYDSKNKEPVETVTVAEVLTSTMVFNRAYTDSVTLAEEVVISTQYIFHENPADGISISDSLVFFHDGMLNTNMLNTRLISVGSQEVTGDDITITHTVG